MGRGWGSGRGVREIGEWEGSWDGEWGAWVTCRGVGV